MPLHRVCYLSAFTALLLFISVFSVSPVQAWQANPSGQKALALRGATIHPADGSEPFVGTVLIKDGMISEVGPEVQLPDDIEIKDLEGFVITPGLIDSRSVLWMTAAARNEASSTGALSTVDGIDPWQDDWREVARQGITSVYVQPSSRGSLGGYGAVLRVAKGNGRDSLIIHDQAGVQTAFGLTGATSRDRKAQYDRLKRSIEAAIDAKKKEKDKDKNEKEAGTKEKEGEEKEDQPTPTPTPTPRPQPRPTFGRPTTGRQSRAVAPPSRSKEVMRKIIDREIALRIEAHHRDAIGWAEKLASEFDIRVVIDGASHGIRPGSKSSTPIIAGPLFETGTVPAYRTRANWDWLPGIVESDRVWALGSFATSGRGSQTLRLQAAKAVAAGIDRSQVLRAVTSNAARLLGVDDKVGTIQAGKQADLAVFAGDPLDPSVPLRMVISKGQITWQTDVAVAEPDKIVDSPDLESVSGPFAVKSNRVWIDGKLQPATMVIRDGKIAEIGANVSDDSLPLIDAGDAVITPGLVTAHGRLGQTNQLTDSAESDQSHVAAVDAFDPFGDQVQPLLDGGFVHVGFAPASTVTSAGGVGQLRLGSDQYVATRLIGGQFSLVATARNAQRFPSSINGQHRMMQMMFAGENPSSNLYVSAEVQKKLLSEKQASVKDVLNGNRRAIIEADTELEIEVALKLVNQHKLSGVLATNGRVGRMLDAIKDSGVGLVVGPFSGAELDAQVEEIAKAAEMGIPVAFAGSSAEQIRMTAAAVIGAGMSPADALHSLTDRASGMTGMKKGTAVLAKDNDADFVIWTGMPTNLAARPVGVFVNGKQVSGGQGK